MAGDKEYQVKSIIVCDDVRREDNGKEILIGVYTDTIVTVKEPPIVLPKLCIRIQLSTKKSEFKNVSCKIISPSRKEIFSGNSPMKIENPDDPTIVTLAFSPAPLPMAGVYSIRFGMDVEPRKIGQFEVRVKEPSSDPT